MSIVGALLLLVAPLAHGGAAAPATLGWHGCGQGFECASLAVPVDYSAPDAEQVDLAVSRRPADDPAHRIGVLFVNYGGPGDPGSETLRQAASSLPDIVRQRFDVVSFDPRGTGSSRPIDCVDDATFDRLWDDDITPNSPTDLPRFYDGSAASGDFIAGCIARQGEWLAQVGSRNVARDLDRLRAALGESKLNYLGYSYGTVIGAVYAQEFPKRIRTMVLDSVVDLSSTPQQQQDGNTRGFEHALNGFLYDCAARTDCPFHSGGDPRTALFELRDRFENGLTLPSADGRRVGVSEFYVGVVAALYSEETWPILADALNRAVRDGDGTELRLFNDIYTGRRDNGTYNNFQEALAIIGCADRPQPRVSFDEYRRTFERLSARYPFFGRAFAGSPLGCDPRLPKPAAGEDVGDVRTTKAPPILIVGVTHDPATPYAGSIDLRRRIAGSRVLTVESTRHGGFAQGLACVDGAVDRYLASRTLPPRSTRCKGAAPPDFNRAGAGTP
jgi:pimeloyl-ACP methyl ester carboxylesterase